MRAQVDMEMYVLTFLGKEHIKFTWNIQSAAAKIISFMPSYPSEEPLKKLADCNTNTQMEHTSQPECGEMRENTIKTESRFSFVYELNSDWTEHLQKHSNRRVNMLKNVMLWMPNYGKCQTTCPGVHQSLSLCTSTYACFGVCMAKPLWVMGTQQVTFHPKRKRTHSTEPY